ncbi:PAS domain S-box protein [Amphiplicatus metriothermophilus]|uniref:PAS domain S-box-containing protein n=1 Tax=Amphiplicatus metriothermophilus TaxID=1519374 RepID=A0A239Q0U4_9PROT|nr:PAS domain S-box protein [Amphiplicatus metriothermophilus]MBB5520061.1 PAS domain S-box-containing protein [Amphiplicatus metriothermophilus]SNT75846.1 PAS domain S-box-containing protein [Amphiplicatus metriothermophilus]
MDASESIYKRVLDTMEHGYVFYDATGQIRLYNRAACRILGASPGQLEGKTSYDPDWRTIREDDSPFPPDQHPIIASLKGGVACYGVVMGMHRIDDGRLRWLQINSDAVREEKSGEIIGAVASFDDITQQINQKRYLAHALRERETETRALSENASYVRDTLAALAGEIAEANARLIEALTPAGGEALECARALERKTEKLVRILSQRSG